MSSPAPDPPVPLLEARRLHLRHPRGERDVVRDVSLRVARGEIVALVGPNGSGKSTTLAALGGGLVPREGDVLVDGLDVRRLGRHMLARRVARLPQEPLCPEGLTVADLVLCGRHPHRGWLEMPRHEDRNAVSAAIRTMGLADLRHRRVETLSGGERRRAWIAMVLAQRADLLLLDEPTAALDLRHQHEVLDLLVRVNHERGTGIVLVLHDLEHAARVAHRVAVMHRGRLYHAAPPAGAIVPEMLRDVFGVAARVDEDDGRLRVRVDGPADPERRF
jgi:iron complex transport system ATP-binding protein